jgi:hypothetical protein
VCVLEGACHGSVWGLLRICLQDRTKAERKPLLPLFCQPYRIILALQRLIKAATCIRDSRNPIVCGFCVRLHSPADPVLLLLTAHSILLPCCVSLLPLLASPPDSSSQGLCCQIAVTTHISRLQPTSATLPITHSAALLCPSSHTFRSPSPQGLCRQQNPV